MAVTQSVLLAIGVLAAALSYLGLFKPFQGSDNWTRVLLLFTAAMLWGGFGLSSFDVVRITSCCEVHVTILPLVYLGFGFAFVIGLFAIYELFRALGAGAREASEGMLT